MYSCVFLQSYGPFKTPEKSMRISETRRMFCVLFFFPGHCGSHDVRPEHGVITVISRFELPYIGLEHLNHSFLHSHVGIQPIPADTPIIRGLGLLGHKQSLLGGSSHLITG